MSTEIEEIARFKEALNRQEDESDSEEEFVGPVYSNRGKKLKREARQVYQGKMNVAPFEGHGVKLIQYGDKKEAVVYRKRRIEYSEQEEQSANHKKSKKSKQNQSQSSLDVDQLTKNGELESENDDEDDEDEIDPYEDIKLRDLLAPIGHPSEVPMHAAINKTFTGNTLDLMAKRAMEIINEEQRNGILFSKLMNVFLGDDPSYALVDNMDLPAYDHLHDSTNDNPNATEEALAINPSENGARESSTTNGSGDRRLTRNQVSQEMDPFFDTPQINIDRDYGVSKEEAEETRQFTQIAQQRSEEFVRCMTNVRMGLTRADRLRTIVYKWCKEMNGEGEGMSEGGDNAESDESDDDDDDES